MTARRKILHIGNIANNAYVNAGLLREHGHVCHVACYDFYHFAGCSEWQDLAVDIDQTLLGDFNYPNFWKLGELRPDSPRWFAQGPQERVLTYLGYLARGEKWLARTAWACLRYARFKVIVTRDPAADNLPWTEERFQDAIAGLPLTTSDKGELFVGRMCERIAEQFRDGLRRFNDNASIAGLALPLARDWLASIAKGDTGLAAMLAKMPAGKALCAMGVERDTAREAAGEPGESRPEDRAAYELHLPRWRWLMRQYDLVIAYGPDPIQPYLVNDGPFVAYEHGTLRDIPFEDNAQGRLVAAAYPAARIVFSTNNDYLTQSRKLPIAPERLVSLPHAFDERPLRAFARSYGRRRPEVVTFFAPARQDWVKQYRTMTKNNHFIMHAAKRLSQEGLTNFRVIFVAWGDDVAASRTLIAELGLDGQFSWVEPMNKRKLWECYLDAHAVIDQFLLPSLSGVSFEALALGCRVITHDDGIANRLAFGEQPPFLPANDIDSVTEQMRRVIVDPLDLAGVGQASAEWVDRRHSARRIVEIEEAAFERLAPLSPDAPRGAPIR